MPDFKPVRTLLGLLFLVGGCRASGADVSVALAAADRPLPDKAAAASDNGPPGPQLAAAGGAAAPATPKAPADAKAPELSAAGPVATVNDQPIAREPFNALLVEAYGKQMLQAVVALEVVKQRAKIESITVTPADIAAEEFASYPEELRTQPPADRDRLLDDYLARNRLTRVHWRLAVERQAYLRALAAKAVPPPKPEELKALFDRTYGEKVQVRMIQVESAADLAKAQARLRQGELFGTVAKEMSVNQASAANDGLLPPFNRDDLVVPEEIRKAAFAMDKPDQVSGAILDRGRYHLIQFVKRIPKQDVKLEDPKISEPLSKQLREQMIRIQMNLLLRTLPAAADIKILDPVIKRQADQARSESAEPAPPGSARPELPESRRPKIGG